MAQVNGSSQQSSQQISQPSAQPTSPATTHLTGHPDGHLIVGDLAQQFLSLEPQKNPARLAFYHYLKNLLPLQNVFTQDMLDGFYDRTLMLQYWQSNRIQLGETLRSDLIAIAARRSLSFDPEQVLHACDLQVITLDQPRDFQALLGKIVKKFEQSGDKIRSFSLEKEFRSHAPLEELMIRLQKTGRLIVEAYSNIAILLEGEPHLVRPHTRLIYNAELDLEPKVDQILATSLMRVARFEKWGPRLKGSFVQGTGFHRTESFERPLNEVPELFQAVKRIERFYVNPITDPDYSKIYEEMLNEKMSDQRSAQLNVRMNETLTTKVQSTHETQATQTQQRQWPQKPTVSL